MSLVLRYAARSDRGLIRGNNQDSVYAGPRLLAENGKWVRDRLARNGVPQEAIEKHLSVIGNPPAMEAALAWYRASSERQPIAPTKVPTLFI